MSVWGQIGGALGISDNYDDDAAKANLAQVNAQNTQAYSNYDNTTQANQAQNSAIAGTNYYSNAQDVYGQQQQAASMLQNQANGTAPSAAQIQMGIGLGQANQQAQSAALSQQGGVLSGNTQRNLLNAQAANSQSVIGQTAAQRATDQATAQQNYSSALASMQSGQQSLGTAQLAQQNTALQNSQAMNQQNLQDAQQTAGTQYTNNTNYLNALSGRQSATSTGYGNLAGKAANLLVARY